MRERPVRDVPRWALGLLLAGLVLQIGWHWQRPGPQVNAEALPAPPSIETLRIASMGDPWVTAKLLVIWLQAFDNQPGISIPFRDLDYDRVQAWLTRSLELDPAQKYPLLAASRLYAQIPEVEKKSQMLDFVYEQFLIDPNHRWQWLAHAAIVAKHQLKDMQRALKYAQAITELADGPDVPNWAKHMSVIVLEDMGELDAAALLIYNLLESGVVTDPHEVKFLGKKLEELKAGL